MVEIQVSEKSKDLAEWEDQLEEMIVGYKTDINEKYRIPKLIHCRKEYEGKEAIEEYLKDLAKFAEGWRNCFCER